MGLKQIFRRHVILINRSFQLRYALLLLLLSLITGAIFIYLIYGYVIENDEVVLSSIGAVTPEIVGFFTKQHGAFLTKLMLLAGFWGIMFFVFGLFISNKIYGPIFAIRRKLSGVQTIDDLASTRIKLRTGDEFEELAMEINRISSIVKSDAKGQKK